MADPWTPGPWEAYCGEMHTRVYRHSQSVDDAVGSVQICEIAGPTDSDLREFNAIRWEADARLIACSPTMAAFLSRIADDALNCGCNPCRGDCTSDAAKAIALDAIRDEARALLARIRNGGNAE